MADEKAKIVTDATGPGSGPAPAQPEVDAQVSKQEQSAPEAPTPDKAEAPAQEAPAQDKAADAPKEQKAASVSVFNFSEIMAEKKATERAAAQQEAKAPEKAAYIKPKNQRYIAVAIEGQQSAPSLSQAQRMRELDQKGVLNGDVIDGIMMEDKKEVDKVILTGAELGKYFGKETTPREMKDQIIKLLDDWKGQQKEVAKPEKKAAQQEK